MNLKDAPKLIELLQQVVAGKTIQFKDDSGFWIDIESRPSFALSIDRYRIKPEPKLRPWRPEEIPMLAWYRNKGKGDEWMTLAGISAYGGRIRLSLGTGWLHAAEELEHSTDGGKTWLPCGVMEDAV